MRKTQDEKFEIRTHRIASADKVEWQRHIENAELAEEIRKIQERYGLPLVILRGIKHISAKEVFDWMGWTESIDFKDSTGEAVFGPKGQRREKLRSEVKELITRFGIPSRFFRSLHDRIVLGIEGPDFSRMGFPSFNFRKDEDGTITPLCIITPETDLGNPVVLDFIKGWQVSERGEIPHPQTMRNDKRRLDWRPVWEWRNRHPNVSDAEIAKNLGKNRVTVSRALEKLDKENKLQNQQLL